MAQWLAKGLAHIGIFTPDADGCAAFYVNNLGFELFYEYPLPGGGKVSFVRCGGCIVEFISSSQTFGSGVIDHIAIEVQNLDALVEELKGKGIAFTYEANRSIPDLFPTGSRVNFFTGPAGERIELYEYAR